MRVRRVGLGRWRPHGGRSDTGPEPAAPVVQLDEDESFKVSMRDLEADMAADMAADVGGAPGSVHRTAPETPSRSQIVRLVALVVLIVIVIVIGTVLLLSSGPPTVDELRRRAGLEGKQELFVGISGDVPGISNRQPGGGYAGFDVDIAYLVARGLGFRRDQVRFLEVTPENRIRMIGKEHGGSEYHDLDLVVAAFSITDARKRQGAVFAGPYLRTETTVLTRRDHPPVESLGALSRGGGPDRTRPQRVCAPGTSTSADRLEAESGADVHLRQRNSECVQGLLGGSYDAVVTDAAILAGFAAAHPGDLKLNNIASTDDEWWGIGVGYDPSGNDERVRARRQLVLLTLNDAFEGSEWSEAFDRNLRALQDKVLPVPGEDAQQIGADHQPKPDGKVAVRRWPWERVGAEPRR